MTNLTQAFSASGQTVLNASGTGSVTLRPHGCDWIITTSTVQTSTSVKQPTATITIGGNFVGGSQSGAFDSASGGRDLAPNGSHVTCTWTGGDSGATATFYISGIQTISGQAAGLL